MSSMGILLSKPSFISCMYAQLFDMEEDIVIYQVHTVELSYKIQTKQSNRKHTHTHPCLNEYTHVLSKET